MHISKSLHSFQSVFLLGIGGIGMSALARWFHKNGFIVQGYDRTQTLLCKELEAEGIVIIYKEEVENLPKALQQANLESDSKERTLIIYTPAIPKNQPQFVYFQQEGFTLLKRSVVLGELAKMHKCIGVAGTHGKTTTSTMLAYVLKECGLPVTAFLGGISQQYETNLLLSNEPPADTWFVAEADEYDRSFLTLYPLAAIVTNTDADHLDIYGGHDSLLTSFNDYIAQIKPNGYLAHKEGLPLNIPTNIQVESYGTAFAQFTHGPISIADGAFNFQVFFEGVYMAEINLKMPGYHNVENALAVMAVATKIGVEPAKAAAAISSFRGVKRRFEYHIESKEITYIDDYAHHPTEIEAFLSSVNALYPNRRVVAIFQPHLFSRTNDFAEGFSKSLSLAAQVVLLPIYPARELPMEGVSSEMLMPNITVPVQLLARDEVIEKFHFQAGDVVCTIGAGDIDVLVPLLANHLKNKLKPLL